MSLIISLFWIGLLIAVALFVFNLAIGLIGAVISMIIGGFAMLFDKLRGR